MQLQDGLVLYQSLWHVGRSLGTPCRRLLNIILPFICTLSDTERICSSIKSLANVLFLRRQSTGLVVLELGDQFKNFALGLCYHAPDLSRLFPSVAALRPLFEEKFFVRVTFLTGSGLVSD